MPKRSKLIVVANRLPVRRVGTGVSARWETSPGGLVSALEPALEDRGGVWVGWTGAPGRGPRPFRASGIEMVPVALSEKEENEFYHGMSNRTFWPLYHDAVRTPTFNRNWWLAYVEANKRFARAAARRASRGDIVWVHDYHLQLVPRMVRELKPGVRIGFFLHIPFPPDELFAWLPWRTEILRGLLGADVVGFQTPEAASNFAKLARRFTPAVGSESALEYEGRIVRCGAFPISIDYVAFDATAREPTVIAAALQIRDRVGSDRRIILSVDRLDYTKGIDYRLQTYADLLRRGRISVERTVHVQIAVPSREPVPDYAEIRNKVEQTVGRINGEYAIPGRVAVHYFRRSLSREDLIAWYLAADVMLVTPLRDGMNLVAKEYVACRTANTGVLVLSEFAGAARELRRAMLVNPRDMTGMGDVLIEALRMPSDRAQRDMSMLRAVVRKQDVRAWADTFIQELK
jgi:trehalose 6-phosphate synthase